MKRICIVCLAAGLAFMMNAQTNSSPPGAETLTPPASVAAEHTTNSAPVRPPSEVSIVSDNGGVFNFKSNVFVYRGNVRVTDDPLMRLASELLTLEAPKLGTNKFNRATAETNVVIDFLHDGMTNHATAQRVVWTYSVTNLVTNDLVFLSGNVVITNLQGYLSGDPLIWDRIRDTVTSPNQLTTVIYQRGTNSPSLFGGHSRTNSPKPKPAPASAEKRIP